MLMHLLSFNLYFTGNKLVPDEQRLLDKVFRNYDNSVRPVYNATTSVRVRFGLALVQIMDMVSKMYTWDDLDNKKKLVLKGIMLGITTLKQTTAGHQ